MQQKACSPKSINKLGKSFVSLTDKKTENINYQYQNKIIYVTTDGQQLRGQ